jgi:hypothetical protein
LNFFSNGLGKLDKVFEFYSDLREKGFWGRKIDHLYIESARDGGLAHLNRCPSSFVLLKFYYSLTPLSPYLAQSPTAMLLLILTESINPSSQFWAILIPKFPFKIELNECMLDGFYTDDQP